MEISSPLLLLLFAFIAEMRTARNQLSLVILHPSPRFAPNEDTHVGDNLDKFYNNDKNQIYSRQRDRPGHRLELCVLIVLSFNSDPNRS